MQRLLVHRAVLDPVDGPRLGARPVLQPAFEQGDDGRFTAADRPHQQQNPFPDFESLRRRLEIFDNFGDRLLDAEQLAAEKVIPRDLVSCAFGDLLSRRRENHVADAGVRERSETLISRDQLEVFPECSFPNQELALAPMSFEHLGEIHGIFLLCHGCYSWPSSPLPMLVEINSPLWVQLSVLRLRAAAGKLKEEGKRRLFWGLTALISVHIRLSRPSHVS